MLARATLSIDGDRTLGSLTDQYPESGGRIVLVLDTDPSRQLGPGDLPHGHLIMLHGPRETVRDALRMAGEAGFAVVWPADEPTPEPSQN